jgi:hypothetical protein
MESVLFRVFRELVLIRCERTETFSVTVTKAGLVDADLSERPGAVDANDDVVYSNETKDSDSDFSGPFFEGPVTNTSILLFAGCGALFNGGLRCLSCHRNILLCGEFLRHLFSSVTNSHFYTVGLCRQGFLFQMDFI